MIETEQMELPLAVQRSELKQTEFPWRILSERKVLPRKRAAGLVQRGIRPAPQPLTLFPEVEG